MAEQLALVDKRDGYAVITINRPEKRNAMSLAAQSALREALRDCLTMKVIVVTGVGQSFCAGVDLVESRENRRKSERRYASYSDHWFETQEDIRRHPAVFIAAVNGFALGGGLTLVNNCELAVAAGTAQFGMPEMGLGSFPTLAGPSTVHRILPKHAAQMIFTSRRIDAETALRWGIVNEVVPADQLLPRAEQLAEHIAGFNEIALDYGKKAYRRAMSLEWADAIDYGILTSRAIRSQTTANDENVKKFATGTRSEGQGSGKQ
jgi:enoyl-CoA hydratase/carnithine racemase